MGTIRAAACFVGLAIACGVASAAETSLWELANANRPVHRFSTLFTAQNVRSFFRTEEGIASAIDWCKKTGVTKVYIETFRGGYQADRAVLENAKKRFTEAGIEVSGCITPTRVLKISTNWKEISCYTDKPTQQKLVAVFEFAASIFDEIMIDDFWFTDCTCPECEAARKAKKVVVGQKTYDAPGDTWEDYRCELMVNVSRDCVLASAKRVNPKAKLIIKYPQWYDRFHERGYEVIRQTADFDRTWVGTETRDYADKQWGGTPQYEAYFIMRWLGGIGGAKCGGGWYDPYGTTEQTYVEQARQTVLGGARESMLFCYGSLLQQTGPGNVEALRKNIPELLNVAAEVAKRKIVGVAAYKPANSHPEKEQRVFDFVGMMGLPLVPCHEFPADAKSAFFSVHALKDADLVKKLETFIAAGKRALITDGLAEQLQGKVDLKRGNVWILPVKGDPKTLLAMEKGECDSVRSFVLAPWSLSFKSPNKVGFYWFEDGGFVIENFNDEAVTARVNEEPYEVGARGWVCRWR